MNLMIVLHSSRTPSTLLDNPTLTVTRWVELSPDSAPLTSRNFRRNLLFRFHLLKCVPFLSLTPQALCLLCLWTTRLRLRLNWIPILKPPEHISLRIYESPSRLSLSSATRNPRSYSDEVGWLLQVFTESHTKASVLVLANYRKWLPSLRARPASGFRQSLLNVPHVQVIGFRCWTLPAELLHIFAFTVTENVTSRRLIWQLLLPLLLLWLIRNVSPLQHQSAL